VLVVVPGPSVGFWAGEWAFWGAPGTNVVPYAGSAAARAVIQDHELWLAPSSLDGKATPRLRLRPGLAAKVRPACARTPDSRSSGAVPLTAFAERVIAAWALKRRRYKARRAGPRLSRSAAAGCTNAAPRAAPGSPRAAAWPRSAQSHRRRPERGSLLGVQAGHHSP
jgi:hypothetical protein